jgi:RNA polymerase sigma-70 factor (ECF subfamily)
MSEEAAAEKLLARVAQQDVTALSELYDRYAPRAYGLAAHILPSREDAEKTLHELFVRLWKESPRLSEEGGSVLAWLVVTARETALARLREHRLNSAHSSLHGHSAVAAKGPSSPRKPKAAPAKSADGKSEVIKARVADRTESLGTLPSSVAWLPEPKEIALIDDRLVLLQKILNQLPKPQRQALELAVFGGLRESEIAAELGEPLGRVRSSLRAAVTFVKHRRRAVCGTWAANI